MKKPGVEITGSLCYFSVWAPEKESMILHLLNDGEDEIPMNRSAGGYFTVNTNLAGEGTKYFYKPNGEKDTPDPASAFQPEGVHGPSMVINHSRYEWNDSAWKGVPFNELIIYEIHVGTFTKEGTFGSIIPFLKELSETGINAIELMPVSQFPGSRNWGYDGVFPYSVQNSYGGPDEFRKLVDACHSHGIAVFLDVVYNHLGPEGNYFSSFGPYFSGTYHVPWGEAINFDGEWSDGVREYFSGNVIHWMINYHLDGLRVDAIHMMFDSGAVNFWELVQKRVKDTEQQTGRKFYLMAECDFNSPRITRPTETGGFGFDAQWLDDFHHALYVLIHPEGKERYEDFGRIEQLEKAYKDGFVHSGEFVKFRKRKHGASSAGMPGNRFIAFNQNHDQIGNRVNGERLSQLVGFDQLKIASAALFMAPYIPLIFMGEEYGEDNPFFYFISHSDENLVKAVREGRRKEFENYKWKSEPPDPQDEDTFIKSRPDREKRLSGNYRILLQWNRELIALRRKSAALQNFNKDRIFIYTHPATGFILHRKSDDESDNILCFFNLSPAETEFKVPPHFNMLNKVLDSADYGKDKPDNSQGSPFELKNDQTIRLGGWGVTIYETKGRSK
jgi:maltooligosyltrehalose trehalohydrolase